MAGLPQYTSNLCANLNYFLLFQKKREKTRKKRKKTSRNIRPALRMFREVFQKMEKKERKYRVSIGELDENPFKFETSIKNETRWGGPSRGKVFKK